MNETLSDKIINASEEETINAKIYGAVYPEKDVAEFIQKLREYINYRESLGVARLTGEGVLNKIDELAGSKFKEKQQEQKDE
jgi:hypothetical protein